MPTEEALDSTISEVEELRREVAEAESESESAAVERTRAIKMERAEQEKRALKARLGRAQAAKKKREGTPATTSEDQTRDELYERAQALDIEGRSEMDKEQLQRAVAAAERTRSATTRPTTPTGTETKNKE